VSEEELTLGQMLPQRLSITNSTGQAVFTIEPKGDVILGEGVSLDEAGRVFWEAVALMAPPGRQLIVDAGDERM
jgi:hypothetical protein